MTTNEQKPEVHVTTETRRELRVLHEWPDVDHLLLALRMADTEIAGIEVTFDAQLQIIQEGKQAALEAVQARKARMEELLETWVEDHRSDYKGKSKQLVHGRVGHRSGAPKVDMPKGEAFTLARVQTRGHGECFVTTPKLDKKGLKKLTPAEQALCGVVVSRSEAFFYKLSKSPGIVYPEISDQQAKASEA